MCLSLRDLKNGKMGYGLWLDEQNKKGLPLQKEGLAQSQDSQKFVELNEGKRVQSLLGSEGIITPFMLKTGRAHMLSINRKHGLLPPTPALQQKISLVKKHLIRSLTRLGKSPNGYKMSLDSYTLPCHQPRLAACSTMNEKKAISRSLLVGLDGKLKIHKLKRFSLDLDKQSFGRLIRLLSRLNGTQCLITSVVQSRHGWHVKGYAPFPITDKWRIAMGDDPMRVKMDRRRTPEERMTLFDFKLRIRGKRND